MPFFGDEVVAPCGRQRQVCRCFVEDSIQHLLLWHLPRCPPVLSCARSYKFAHRREQFSRTTTIQLQFEDGLRIIARNTKWEHWWKREWHSQWIRGTHLHLEATQLKALANPGAIISTVGDDGWVDRGDFNPPMDTIFHL